MSARPVLLLLAVAGIAALFVLFNPGPEREAAAIYTEPAPLTKAAKPPTERITISREEEPRRLDCEKYVWHYARWLDVTSFQRRVSLGGYLNALGRDLSAGRITAADASAGYRWQTSMDGPRGGFSELSADRMWSFEREHEVDDSTPAEDYPIRKLLLRFAASGIDPELSLEGTTSPDHPLGKDLFVRVWSRAGPYRGRSRIAAAESLLRRLDRACEEKSDLGYDVLASSSLGLDSFPELRVPSWAAGIHLSYDDLCIVRPHYTGDFAQRLLNHELIHAWTDRHRGWQLRFISEGLATYLARVNSSDHDFDVPLVRQRDDFALLLDWVAWIEDRAGRPLKVDLASVVECTPPNFYSNAPLSYLVAQACIAYVGGQRAVSYVASDDELGLRDAIAAIRWADLLAFVQRHGKAGKAEAAELTVDVTGHVGMLGMLTMQSETFGLGIHPLWLRARTHPPHTLEALSTRERVGLVARGLRKLLQTEEVVVLTDATTVMEEPLETQARLDVLAGPNPAHGRSRIDYVWTWITNLRQSDEGGDVAAFGANHEIASLRLPLSRDHDVLKMRHVFHWPWRAKNLADGCIVFLASRDAAWQERMKAWLIKLRILNEGHTEEQLEQAIALVARVSSRSDRKRPKWILIVDLAPGTSHAGVLARAWATAMADTTEVAYFNPRKEMK